MNANENVLNANIAIVGAGPAGTALAAALTTRGVDGVVLVDRHDFPRDKTCGSGISPKGISVLKQLGVWDAIVPHAYPIRGLRLVTPGDREIVVSGGESQAAVICCRRVFDHILLERARSQGATFLPNFQVRSLVFKGARVVGFKGEGGPEVRAQITVVADGAHSRFAIDTRPRRLLQAIMGWWEGAPFTAEHVEMVFDRMVSPHYGWLFPESADRVNIGICYEDAHHERNARALFQRFLDKHYTARLAGARSVGRWAGHPISFAHWIGPLTSPGRIVIGEAGRMTHPATGEGIYQGMRSAQLAAPALQEALSRPDREMAAFRRYEWGCRRAFVPSFALSRVWHSAIRGPALDWVVGTSQRLAKRSPRHGTNESAPPLKRALGAVMAKM